MNLMSIFYDGDDSSDGSMVTGDGAERTGCSDDEDCPDHEVGGDGFGAVYNENDTEKEDDDGSGDCGDRGCGVARVDYLSR